MNILKSMIQNRIQIQKLLEVDLIEFRYYSKYCYKLHKIKYTRNNKWNSMINSDYSCYTAALIRQFDLISIEMICAVYDEYTYKSHYVACAIRFHTLSTCIITNHCVSVKKHIQSRSILVSSFDTFRYFSFCLHNRDYVN